MVVAVTGSKGFIGSHLTQRLIKLGHELIEIDSKLGIDVTNKNDLFRIKKFDCLIHLAGKVSVSESFNLPYDYLSRNYLGTLNALEMCRNYNAKMIFASTNIYGEPQYLPLDEEHPYQISNPYMQTKIMGEHLCRLYSNNFGLTCIVLRQFNVYGPGMNEYSIIPTILKQLPSGKVEVKDSRPRRDFVHIDDVVEAYVASLNYDSSGFEAFNIASGKSYSIEQIVKICEYSFINSVQFSNLNERRKNEIIDIETNISKAKSKLKWEPRVTFEAGISKLIELFNKDPKLKYLPSEDQKIHKLKADIIPLSVPSFKGNEWDYVKKCLDTEWVSTAGKFVDKFEIQVTEFTKSKYAVACISGTAALHISLLIAGVLPEDEVIVPTLTFIAPINAVRYCNAYPVFMDSDQYYNIDINKTLDFILNETEIKTATIDGVKSEYSFNKKTGRRVSAIIPVHIFGNAVWLDELIDICKRRNIKIIEDATESLGSQYTSGKFKGKYTGTIGDLGCLSFNGNKIITTGGGGMILTDNQKYAKKANYLTTQAKDDKVRFIHNSIGYNYRLTNLQAALGSAQMERLQDYLKIKKDNYFYYKNYIDKIDGLHLAETPGYVDSNYWMYALQIYKEKYGRDREELMYHLSKRKIQTRPIWYLNHKQAAYKQFQTYNIRQAEVLLNNTLNIPCSVNLHKHNIDKVIESLNER